MARQVGFISLVVCFMQTEGASFGEHEVFCLANPDGSIVGMPFTHAMFLPLSLNFGVQFLE